MQTTIPQAEWVNILSKGVITIPKKMREKAGMREGDVARIRLEGARIIIEPKEESLFADVRSYSAKQLEQWIKEDELPSDLAKQSENFWKDLP